MIKILFVCHGNICRSPMAEFIMKDLVKKSHISDQFEIASAATSTEEIGNPVYPPARRKLASQGINCDGKTARQIRQSDYDYYDYLIGMDSANIRNMTRFWGDDKQNKIYKMLEFAGKQSDVADPWYTDNFEATWNDCLLGCKCLIEKLIQSGKVIKN